MVAPVTPPKVHLVAPARKVIFFPLVSIFSAFLLAGLTLPVFGQSPVVINEIHYNPDISTEQVEFIELYNNSDSEIDLSGWTFTSGIHFTLPPGTMITARGYVVVSEDPVDFQAKFAKSAMGPWVGKLNNEGETIVLRNALGEKMDEVDYQLGFPWPIVGDTPGYSIELINPDLDNSLGGSWRASVSVGEIAPSVGPTPGMLNAVFAANSPPQIRQVDHSPKEPVTGEVVTISAKVTDPDGVAAVTLQYQVVDPGSYIEITDATYTNTWTTLVMNDSGTGGDQEAGDDVYTAQLPGSIQEHRRLVRYRVTVSDLAGQSIQVPYMDDDQPNFAYFCYDGVPGWSGSIRPGVAPVQQFPADEMGRLPTYHLIAKKTTVENATWFDKYRGDEYLYVGTLIYDGEVYDHVQFRMRGGVWRFSMVKNMWKFRMHRGHYFQARDDWGRKYPKKWGRVNLGAGIQQGTTQHRGEQHMFESTGFRFFNLAGIEGPSTTYVTYRIIDEVQESFAANQFEGDFWGVYLSIEELDGRWMESHGMPDGNLYKMENNTGPPGASGELKNQGSFQVDDYSDLINFQAQLSTARDENWWRSNLDVTKYINYYTMVQGIHHYDIGHGKNYFFYFNSVTGLCEVHPWDLDLTWADNMYDAQDGGTDKIYDRGHPFNVPGIKLQLKNRAREILDLLYNGDQGFRIVDEQASLLSGTSTGPNILVADRAMWDYNPKMNNRSYTPNLNKAGTGKYYVEATSEGTFDAMVEKMKDYIISRGTDTSYPSGTPLAVWEQDPAIPSTPVVTYAGPEGFPVNELFFQVSNFSGSGGFSALKWRIAEITPSDAPASNQDQPNKYEIEANWESEEITVFNSDITIPVQAVRADATYRVRARFKDTTGRWSHWSLPLEFKSGQPSAAVQLLASLRISEIMYNPPGGSNFEFVELHNTSSEETLNLLGAKFTQGIDFFFPPGTEILPGGYLLVYNNPEEAAFRAAYHLGPEVNVVGPYTGKLNNSGENLVLRTSAGGADIAAFNYQSGRGWPITADGAGHSLIPLKLANQADGALNYGGNWRASTNLDGSPGMADPLPTSGLRLNEIRAHTDLDDPAYPGYDSNDWIELYNAGDVAISLNGYYLSDDPDDLMKWPIPLGLELNVGAFITFDETTGFHSPYPDGFGINKSGEQVLLTYTVSGSVVRVQDASQFRGQENGASLGRIPDGGAYWVTTVPTRGAANQAASPHPVIAEIMYHPLADDGSEEDSDYEFIEIYNPSQATVQLWTLDHKTFVGNWRISGNVNYTFPNSTLLSPGARILLLPFSPLDTVRKSAFSERYNLSPTVPLYGPYDGTLSNQGGRLTLEKPQAPDAVDEELSWIIVDELVYFESDPWMEPADGLGYALHRTLPGAAAADPASWIDAVPSPGSAIILQSDLQIKTFELTAGSYLLGFDLLPNLEYTLESTTNLLENSWQPRVFLKNQTEYGERVDPAPKAEFFRLRRK